MPRKTKKPSPSKRRGLLPNEYFRCWRMVRSGKATWEELEEAGVCEPPSRETHEAAAFRQGVEKRLAALRRKKERAAKR